MQRSLQLQMRKPSIETMGTVDCEQGMEGWYDAAVCGLVREVVGVYTCTVSSIMCGRSLRLGIRPLDPTKGEWSTIFHVRPYAAARRARPRNRPYQFSTNSCTNWMRRTQLFGNSMPCATEGFSRAPAECGRERQPSGHHHRCLILLSPCASAPVFRPSHLAACWSLLEVGWCKVEFRISHYALRAPRMS